MFIPKESIVTLIRLQTEGIETKVNPLPLVKKSYVEIAEPTLQSPEPDLERVIKSLRERSIQPSCISPKILSILPETLRSAGWKATFTVWNDREIIDVEEGNSSKICYGLAIDVGTTKIACYLIDLMTGRTVALSSAINPQIWYGEDVITRISYAKKGKTEKKELQSKVVDGINRLIAECCLKYRVAPRHIYEAAVVGNTVMHHLLVGINPEYLALSPYVPASKCPFDFRAQELNLDINPQANIHFLPIVAGFVGSDCVADILATGLFKAKDPCLLLDIGTNTEVVVSNQNRLLACSCASGPAFEGAHIKYGMKAARGAIESVKIDVDTLEVTFRTIGNVKPEGLCGSGVVDVAAEMLTAGIIDQNCRIMCNVDTPHIRMNRDGEREFVIAHAGKTSPRDIVVTQRDLREIQLGKGAILTGISILMQEMNVKADDILHLYIAGAFGTYINPVSAKAIEMIPNVPLDIVGIVGNAAGMGARMALISSKARVMCERISSRVEYVELAAHPDFERVFLRSLRFPNRKD